MDCAQKKAKLLEVVCHNLAREQQRFPVFAIIGYGLHRHQMIGRIFKAEGGGRSGRSKAIQPAQAFCFYPDPLWAAEPILLDSQFGQRLLQHQAVPILPSDFHRAVRYPSEQRLHPDGVA